MTLSIAVLVVFAGCPSRGVGVRLYRSLGEPGAMETCNANKSFQVSAAGRDEADARAKAEDKARDTVRANGGCGLLVSRDGLDRKNIVWSTSFQLCECAPLHAAAD